MTRQRLAWCSNEMGRALFFLMAVLGACLPVSAFSQQYRRGNDLLDQSAPSSSPVQATLPAIDGAKAIQALMEEINNYRQQKSLPPLQTNEILAAVAQDYSNFLAANKRSGDFADGRTPIQRAKDKGYSCPVSQSSSIYPKGPQDDESAAIRTIIAAWKSASSEEANMTSSRNKDAGVGVSAWIEGDQSYYVFVLMYGGECESTPRQFSAPASPGSQSITRADQDSPPKDAQEAPSAGRLYGDNGDRGNAGDGGNGGGYYRRPDGRQRYGWLGVQVKNVDEEIAMAFGLRPRKGAFIVEVFAGGPAARSGLKRWDLILELDRQAVANPRELARITATLTPGAQVEMLIIRQGREQKITANLGEYPDRR